jgi:hypothetical protein
VISGRFRASRDDEPFPRVGADAPLGYLTIGRSKLTLGLRSIEQISKPMPMFGAPAYTLVLLASV